MKNMFGIFLLKAENPRHSWEYFAKQAYFAVDLALILLSERTHKSTKKNLFKFDRLLKPLKPTFYNPSNPPTTETHMPIIRLSFLTWKKKQYLWTQGRQGLHKRRSVVVDASGADKRVLRQLKVYLCLEFKPLKSALCQGEEHRKNRQRPRRREAGGEAGGCQGSNPIQPWPSMTPARRAKERSLSCDRWISLKRRTLTWTVWCSA